LELKFAALNAQGPILVSVSWSNLNRLSGVLKAWFKVDSHVEVFEGWLEPMLDRFVNDSKALVMPRVIWLLHTWMITNSFIEGDSNLTRRHESHISFENSSWFSSDFQMENGIWLEQ
jgi:hypothetical protein